MVSRPPQSTGSLSEGCEPLRLISTFNFLSLDYFLSRMGMDKHDFLTRTARTD
jgi:hypothetical protein